MTTRDGSHTALGEDRASSEDVGEAASDNFIDHRDQQRRANERYREAYQSDDPGHGVNEMENDRQRQAVEHLPDGQREALEAVRRALEGPNAPTEDMLVDLLDILEGASQDARYLGNRRTGRSVIVRKEPDAVASLGRLLGEWWRGKVRRGEAAGSRRPKFLFATVLTVYSGDSEQGTRREDNA